MILFLLIKLELVNGPIKYWAVGKRNCIEWLIVNITKVVAGFEQTAVKKFNLLLVF
jgi:hypothetical protein